MNHKAIFCLLPVLIALACASCTEVQTQPGNPLIGQWQGMSGTREVTINLYPDGTCEGLEEAITRRGRWQQKGPSVIIAFEGDALYGGLISRREMLITMESTGRTITLAKTSKQLSK